MEQEKKMNLTEEYNLIDDTTWIEFMIHVITQFWVIS